jgi:glycosyltransferase involved in cell wall biosynthesis
MNVLLLATWYPYPPDNGSKLRVFHLLQALEEVHSVTLLAFAFATAKPEDAAALSPWQHQAVVAIDPFVANHASALRTFLSLSPIAARPAPAMQQLAGATLAQRSFDVVIASTGMMAPYMFQAPSSTTRILEEHNSLTRWMAERYQAQTDPLQKLRCWLSWQKTRRYEARLFNRFDLVTMVSQQDQAVCHADLPGYHGRVEVVPNGVDCTHNRLGLASPQPNRLVFNGSLTYSANYDAMRWFLAEVYPLIKAQQPAVSLTITGALDGVDLSRLALDASVQFTGFVEDVRLPVAEATVAVAPIRQGGGTRLKILEAMALGTPVVATTKGAEGLDVIDGEHLLLADTPQTFAQAVLTLLANGAARAALAAHARRMVEAQFDWREIGARFVALVEQAVAKRQAARSGDCG